MDNISKVNEHSALAMDGNWTDLADINETEWKTEAIWRRKIDGRFRFCTVQAYNGLPQHYICGYHEYCCALRCCSSTPFSFYQLWYFWLFVLLIILLCSGGGWWFRWRHGNFGTRNSTPAGGRRRHGRHSNSRSPRVYPHTYYTPGGGNGCNLPPGYDKDPPSYNEVISHLSQFPRPEDQYMGHPPPINRNDPYTRSISGTVAQPSAPDCNLLSVPPPTYQMVLESKNRENTQNNVAQDEHADERPPNRISSTRSKIQRLLGKARRKNTRDNLPPPVASFPAAVPSSSSSSSSSSVSSGLFTISSESLPTSNYYAQNQNQNPISYIHPPGHPRSIPSPSESSGSSSHSDYSSSFLSSPSSISRSPSTSPTPSTIPAESPPSYSQAASSSAAVSRPTTSQQPPEILEDHLEVGRGETLRPTTGRSVLSRPTTSISARSLPPPDNIQRKTSLPGALLESDNEDGQNQDDQNRTST